LSDRELSNRLKGHLASLDDPVADLSAGLKIVADRLPRPHILVAHSMGGGISLRALQTRRLDVEAALFSAPMWGIAGLKKWQRQVARFAATIGLGGLLAPGATKIWKKEPFKRNPVTHSRERHARNQALVMAEPRLALGGVTFGWVDAAATAFESFYQPSAHAHLRFPVIVCSAGEESIVDNEAHAELAAHIPQARHITIEGAKHEIIQEVDEIRAHFLAAFDELAAAVAPHRAMA
jgi:lysophospholipase